MTSFRSEPYRLFFPLAVLAGISGTVHWVLFAFFAGAWNVPLHVLLQFPAYVGIIAAGFLGTAVPRITGTNPLSRMEFGCLLVLAVLLSAAPFWTTIAGEIIFAIFAATIVIVFARRQRSAARFPPPLFWIYFAGTSAIVGVIFDATGTADGRPLWTQGFILPLVLGIAPIIGRRIINSAPTMPGPGMLRGLIIAMTLLAVSLLLEAFASDPDTIRGAYALRFFIVFMLIRHAQLPELWKLDHPQPRFLLVALLCTAAGYLLAAIFPADRKSLLHVTFIAGFSLMIATVAYRVVLMHAGRSDLFETLSRRLNIMGALILGASAIRVSAELFPRGYAHALGGAAILWITAHLLLLWIIATAAWSKAHQAARPPTGQPREWHAQRPR